MKKHPEKIFQLIFTLIGVVFLIVGAVSLYGRTQAIQNAQKIEAEIVEVSKYYDRQMDEFRHNVTAKYEIDGQIYTGMLGFYWTGMTEGSKISILVDPQNPYKVSPPNAILEPIFLGLGAVFFSVGVLVGVITKKSKQQNNSPEFS